MLSAGPTKNAVRRGNRKKTCNNFGRCEKCHERFATVHLKGGPAAQPEEEHHYCEVCFPTPREVAKQFKVFGLLPKDEPGDQQ